MVPTTGYHAVDYIMFLLFIIIYSPYVYCFCIFLYECVRDKWRERRKKVDATDPFGSLAEVENFLERFHTSSNVDDVFTKGCCYWFAWILLERFSKKHPILMYDSVDNHFGVMIGKRVYDITGDVTEKYSWEKWDSIDDEYLKSYIKRDCIMF